MNTGSMNLLNMPGGDGRRLLLSGLLCITLAFCGVVGCRAQSNLSFLRLGLSALYERGFDATVSYEHTTRYHRAWEFFGTYYIKYATDPEAGHITKDSFWHDYNSWQLGICYKPCVSRGKNHYGNIRFGGSLGSDMDHVIGGVHLGYEHTYVLRGGLGLFFLLKEDVTISGKDLFRTGVSLGIKVPL